MLGGECIAKPVVELFEEFPLIGDLGGRTVANLIGGERKLASIALALMLRPRVLLVEQKALEALAGADRTHVFVSEQFAISEHLEELRDKDRLASAFLGGSDHA